MSDRLLYTDAIKRLTATVLKKTGNNTMVLIDHIPETSSNIRFILCGTFNHWYRTKNNKCSLENNVISVIPNSNQCQLLFLKTLMKSTPTTISPPLLSSLSFLSHWNNCYYVIANSSKKNPLEEKKSWEWADIGNISNICDLCKLINS